MRPAGDDARRRRAFAIACGLAFLLAACVETGDFGRVKPSVWNDIVTRTGALSAQARGEPVSDDPLTDDEGDLRGRAWRFLVPAKSRPWLDRAMAELVATRVLAPEMSNPRLASYHDGLLADDSRSIASRYRRLADDALADARLVEPFARVAGRVLVADGIRLAALRRAETISPAEAESAAARVIENRCLIAWVESAAAFRTESYGYALEHLVVEAPARDAVPAERAIGSFREARGILAALAVPPLPSLACAVDAAGPPMAAPAPQVFEVPLVRKG